MNEHSAGEADPLSQLVIRGFALFERSGTAAFVGNRFVCLAAGERLKHPKRSTRTNACRLISVGGDSCSICSRTLSLPHPREQA